jgi:epoxyqueuosine reductase
MITEIVESALGKGIKLSIIPVACNEDIRKEMKALAENNELSDDQSQTVGYRSAVMNFNVSFTPKSIVTAVWRLRLTKASFRKNGRTVSCIVDDAFLKSDVGDILASLFKAHGYNLSANGNMALKLLAVRSGLCEYGRNNVTYSGDWGSFVLISTYISDMDADEYTWRDTVSMKDCDGCDKCIRNCPTKAILSDRFLINSELCLSFFNKRDRGDLKIPDWIPNTAHHRLLNCTRCMDICPLNKHILQNLEHIEFDENETTAMLEAEGYYDFPESVRKKLWYYDTGSPHKYFPRNLRLMFENPTL